MKQGFREELGTLVNKYRQGCTPDYILAEYLEGCLALFEQAVESREYWVEMTRKEPLK